MDFNKSDTTEMESSSDDVIFDDVDDELEEECQVKWNLCTS